MKKRKELNKNIGSKSLHHFVQRFLVPYVRQQVAKPQAWMRSQQNCSKQEETQHWTECTEYMWWSGKLASGHRNGRSPRSSHFPRKVILNRTIALVSHASKILLHIILERIRVKTETEIADKQSGFQQGKGTRDQIMNLSILMHKACKHLQHWVCALWTSRRHSTLSRMISSGWLWWAWNILCTWWTGKEQCQAWDACRRGRPHTAWMDNINTVRGQDSHKESVGMTGQRWMEKVRPRCGEPSDQGRLKRTEQNSRHRR